MKITDLSIHCKLENMKNWQCSKYLFAPLYIVPVYKEVMILYPFDSLDVNSAFSHMFYAVLAVALLQV